MDQDQQRDAVEEEFQRHELNNPDDDWGLRQQFYREYREGMAADRLEAERGDFGWDIEGWDREDRLLLYIAGSGLHQIPRVEVVRLANAMLAECELSAGWDYEPLTCDTCGRIGNIDDGIEAGGPCQEPCDGVVRYVNGLPPPSPDDALSFDQVEAAGLDGTLRSMT